MAEKPKVIVVGGSLGGLTAALVLRDAGCDVTVYERSNHELSGRGVGIVAHPATLRYLAEQPAGNVSDPTNGVRFMRYLDQAGNIAHEEETGFRFVSYYGLYSQLLDLLGRDRYHLGHRVTGFTDHGESVEVEIEGGKVDSCQLLVCADGIQSAARSRLLPDLGRAYAGYVGWRGSISESLLSDGALAAIADALIYEVIPNSHILTYPIQSAEGSLTPGEMTTNWVWYRNVDDASLAELTTDVRGVQQEISLSPGAVQPRHADALRDAAGSEIAPQLDELVQKTEEPFVQVVFDIELTQLAFGRVCLVGDASSALRPHAAVGTAKAAESAWMLADAVRAADYDIPNALGLWEPKALTMERQALARTREWGQRSQMDNTWEVGEPIPYGLYEIGDSAMPALHS
ncbi:MAG: FAD-dependent monooxygenase [Solirubrobacterales bacterium]